MVGVEVPEARIGSGEGPQRRASVFFGLSALFSMTQTFLLLCAIGLSLANWQQKTVPDLFESLHARSLAQRATMYTISGRFTETTVSSLLVQPIVARGTLIAAKPGRIVMKYTSPEPRTVIVNGNRLVVHWPQRDQQEMHNISQTQERVQRYFSGASPTELRDLFDITVSPDSDVSQTYRVDMRPRRNQIREGLERLQIWVDRETTLMTRMRMVFPDGDSKEIQLEDVQINVPAEDAIFAVPDGPAPKR
jgi:outer membrane lipoprotein-sorting protein